MEIILWKKKDKVVSIKTYSITMLPISPQKTFDVFNGISFSFFHLFLFATKNTNYTT